MCVLFEELDPYEQLIRYLNDFSNDMRTTCRGVKDHLNNARDIIQYDEVLKAMDELEEIMNNILNLLPSIEAFRDRQITLIKEIREIDPIDIKILIK